MKKCKQCGKKLGIVCVGNGFCSFKCKATWNKRAREIKNMEG